MANSDEFIDGLFDDDDDDSDGPGALTMANSGFSAGDLAAHIAKSKQKKRDKTTNKLISRVVSAVFGTTGHRDKGLAATVERHERAIAGPDAETPGLTGRLAAAEVRISTLEAEVLRFQTIVKAIGAVSGAGGVAGLGALSQAFGGG
jgi:hypothetical protein